MSSKIRLVLPAPAKINHFLHIIGRREDGYHQLQTLFQFLNYCDELVFENNNKLQLETELPELQTNSNLILRAARLLQKEAGCDCGAQITLTKRLPLGGGVGGGSSNAATTLLGLNQLWEIGLNIEQLAEMGLSLGADVPVFVRGCSSFAEGVGEKLTPVEPPESWYIVLVPRVRVNTEYMYKHVDLSRDASPITVSSALDQKGRNDFEPLVRHLYPEVDNCLTLLNNFSSLSVGPARLSGSGACVFAPFAHREVADSTLEKMRSKVEGFVARGINESPLVSALNVSC